MAGRREELGAARKALTAAERMRRYRARQKQYLGIVSAEVDIAGLADFLKSEGYLPRGVTADFDALCAAASAFLGDLIKKHYA